MPESCACRHDGRGELTSECFEHERIRTSHAALRDAAKEFIAADRAWRAVDFIHSNSSSVTDAPALQGCDFDLERAREKFFKAFDRLKEIVEGEDE